MQLSVYALLVFLSLGALYFLHALCWVSISDSIALNCLQPPLHFFLLFFSQSVWLQATEVSMYALFSLINLSAQSRAASAEGRDNSSIWPRSTVNTFLSRSNITTH